MIDNLTKAKIFKVAALKTNLSFAELQKEAKKFSDSIGQDYLSGTYSSEGSYCYSREWDEDWYSEALQGLLNSISQGTPVFKEGFVQLLSEIAAMKELSPNDIDGKALAQKFEEAGYAITNESEIFKQTESEMFASIVANYVISNGKYSLSNAISGTEGYLKLGEFASAALDLIQKEKGAQAEPVMDIDAFMKCEEQKTIQEMREIAKPQPFTVEDLEILAKTAAVTPVNPEKEVEGIESPETKRYLAFMETHPNERLTLSDFLFLEKHDMLHDDKGRLAYEQLVEDIDAFINTVPRALRTEENFKQFMQTRTESDPEITNNSERDDE